MACFQVTFLLDPLLLRERQVELVDEKSIFPRHDRVGLALEYVHLVSGKIGSIALSSASSKVATRMADTLGPSGPERKGQPAKDPTPLTVAEKATWN